VKDMNKQPVCTKCEEARMKAEEKYGEAIRAAEEEHDRLLRAAGECLYERLVKIDQEHERGEHTGRVPK